MYWVQSLSRGKGNRGIHTVYGSPNYYAKKLICWSFVKNLIAYFL